MGYSLWGCKESDMTERLSTHIRIYRDIYLYICMYIHTCIYTFFSIMAYHKILNTVPCAIQ